MKSWDSRWEEVVTSFLERVEGGFWTNTTAVERDIVLGISLDTTPYKFQLGDESSPQLRWRGRVLAEFVPFVFVLPPCYRKFVNVPSFEGKS
jgi:hypothetical protein